MKRLNKKGFTLVELLAAIVILAVLMLVGAQAVGTILNNSNANSLVNSLDMAIKQATMKYSEGNLSDCEYIKEADGYSYFNQAKLDKLTDVLTYDENQYEVYACYERTEEVLLTCILADEDGKFKNTKCDHGNLKENAKSLGGVFVSGKVKRKFIIENEFVCDDKDGSTYKPILICKHSEITK